MSITKLIVIVIITINTLSDARGYSPEIEAKAVVFLDLIGTSKESKKTIGLALPNNEVLQIRSYLKLKDVEILSEKEYVARFKNSGKNLSDSCFGVKILEIKKSEATIVGGNVPLDGRSFMDYLYHLTKSNDKWIIVSKQDYAIGYMKELTPQHTNTTIKQICCLK